MAIFLGIKDRRATTHQAFPALLSMLILIASMAATYWVWWKINQPYHLNYFEKLVGITFNPARHNQDPSQNVYAGFEDIENDIMRLQGKAEAIRIYSLGHGYDHIPDIAARYGINSTVGAWLGSDLAENEQEIQKLIALGKSTKRYIVRAVVGNEAILRNEVTVDQMRLYLQRVRKQIWRPVSTAEPWHIWLKYPELANDVDYIGVHILPYWEGIPIEDAADYTMARYNELQQKFPNKPIVLMEVGWPSDGPTIKAAVPSRVNQARFINEFLTKIQGHKITHYIVEAFDQPWKISFEGTAGGYWGLFDADRNAKFSFGGAVLAMPTWQEWALIAMTLAFIPAFAFMNKRGFIGLSGKIFFISIANLATSVVAWSMASVSLRYQVGFGTYFSYVLVVLLVFSALMLLVESSEISEVLWNHRKKREFIAPPLNNYRPKVSIHVPIHNEPPQMVQQTLDALARLDYANYEVLVIDNNTVDPAIWQPVERYCALLGEKFRFFHLEKWPGFKAGALNFGLQQTASDADVIAVIDSDYQVAPTWLRNLAPFFADPKVGFVQAPQDYSDGGESYFKSMLYWEYAGFFHIGMVQRNEYNAIIQHGTMTMIRKTALQQVGGWAEWCICEDAELGLKLLGEGYDSVYVKQSYGHGVMPDHLGAYKGQRFRWAYGALQIMKHHFKALFLGQETRLNLAQRYYFITGWLPWLADALSLLFVFTSIALSIVWLYFEGTIELPLLVFIFPILLIFAFKFVRSVCFYTLRVKCSLTKTLGAAVAGLSLAHTVSKAVWAGLFTSGKPFLRTPKMEEHHALWSALSIIREELMLFVLLWILILLMPFWGILETLAGQLWLAVLLIQSIPYAAALILALSNASAVGHSQTEAAKQTEIGMETSF